MTFEKHPPYRVRTGAFSQVQPRILQAREVERLKVRVQEMTVVLRDEVRAERET